MRPGFNWHTGKLHPSQIVNPELQYVRAGDKRLYRSSILTDRGARSPQSFGRYVVLPNQLNLRLPHVPILWRRPPGFDETKFQVSQRIHALAVQYLLALQRTEAAARRTSNAAEDERSPSPARTNGLLPGPSVPESRRPQRTQRIRPQYAEHSSSSELQSSELSSHNQRSSGSSEPERSESESFLPDRSETPQPTRRRRQGTKSERALIMSI